MKSSARGLPALLRYAEFDLATPERRAFRAHLQRVAGALSEIERADDGEPTGAHDSRAIRDCLRDACVAFDALSGLDQPGRGAG